MHSNVFFRSTATGIKQRGLYCTSKRYLPATGSLSWFQTQAVLNPVPSDDAHLPGCPCYRLLSWQDVSVLLSLQ
jgi:hypothetical protein